MKTGYIYKTYWHCVRSHALIRDTRFRPMFITFHGVTRLLQMSVTVTRLVSSFSPSTSRESKKVHVLAIQVATWIEQHWKWSRGPAWPSNGVWRLSLNWQEEMKVVKLLFSQVDIENRPVVTVHVHVHGALL